MGETERYAEFLINAGFNIQFNPKAIAMLEFSIMRSLTLIVASDAEFHTEHETKHQLQTEVNLNKLCWRPTQYALQADF